MVMRYKSLDNFANSFLAQSILDHLIAVFLIGYSINNRSNQFKITGTFCNNSYRFHYRFGTPPSLPSVHNLDSEYPESMSSLVICILCKVV